MWFVFMIHVQVKFGVSAQCRTALLQKCGTSVSLTDNNDSRWRVTHQSRLKFQENDTLSNCFLAEEKSFA